MERVSTGVKVAIFAIVTTAAALFIYRFVTRARGGSGESYTVHVLMNDATGIAKHSAVRMAGIPIGTIRDVRLEGGRARIDIAVNKDVPLYEDATASKVASSLLGEYFIAVAAGTDGKRVLVDGDEIHLVLEGTSTDDIMRQIRDIASDVKKVTGSLASTVGTQKGQDNIDRTLQNLADATEQLNKVVGENRQSIRNILGSVEGITARGQPEIAEILANVRDTTREVRDLMHPGGVDGGTGAAPSPGEVRQIIEKVNRAATSLESALANIDRTTGRIDRGEGTLGRLAHDERLIDEVQGAAEGVNEFVGGLQRLRTIVGLRTDYQFLGSTVKSYVELRLQPREDKYYVIEVVNDPRGLTRFEQTDVETTNPNQPAHYREVRTVTTNSFRFSLQFAQTIGPFTGRFGIKESTGGVGLDVAGLDRRFELRQDLFGFGEVQLPRYRVALAYEFISRLWLLGGVDNVLSSDQRDYFVGLQLRFDDEDLKTMLPFAPSP